MFDADGTLLTLNSRAFDTLLFMIAHRGQTLSKQQLIEAVWPNAVVEENNLNQAISALRKALGDTQERNRIILTIPGRGYCFVAEIRRVSAAGDAATANAAQEPALPPTSAPEPPHTSTHAPTRMQSGLLLVLTLTLIVAVLAYAVYARVPGRAGVAGAVAPVPADTAASVQVLPNSIAVLPFANLSADPGKDFFALGLHDEILTQLAKLRSLNVISRTTIMRYLNSSLSAAEIARELNVASILEGSVRYAGKRMRLNLQMTDPATSVSLWTATYDADMENMDEIFAIQADIAMNVANALEAEFLPQEMQQVARVPTASPEAYQFYLEGNAALILGNYQAALQQFEEAVARDPEFIEALVQLSMVSTLLTAVPVTSPEEQFEQAMAAATQALAIDPESSYAHIALASALNNAGDWQAAAEEYRLARDLSGPIDSLPMYSLFQLSLGDFAGGRATLGRNLLTDPINLTSWAFLMIADELLGERQRSLDDYATGEALYAEWFGDNTGVWLALGRDDRDFLEKAITGFKGYRLMEVLEKFPAPAQARAQLALIHQNSGKWDPGQLLNAAMWAAYYDEPEMALDFLKAGLSDNWVTLYILWLPVFDELRQREEFRRFLEDSGVVAYWRRNGWPEVCTPVDDTAFECNWRAYP